jgi:hypothetical protein
VNSIVDKLREWQRGEREWDQRDMARECLEALARPQPEQPKPAGEAVDSEDAARLDWFDTMLSEHGCIWFMPSGHDFRFIQVRGADGYCENFPTVKGGVRDAIDAARRLSVMNTHRLEDLVEALDHRLKILEQCE